MLNLKYHTPEGVMDFLPEECAAKEAVEKKIAGVFSSYGYKSVQTPAFEYIDVYSSDAGDVSVQKLFKFFDSQGRTLALRGDITTSIARVMGTKYNSALPARLCYIADAFRYDGSASARSSEFTQAGIELIGDSSCEADAEVIMLAVNSLIGAGLDEFQIDIGQVEFFKGLSEQIGLDTDDAEKIRTMIDFKDSFSIAKILDKYDADKEVKDILCRMPYLFGGADVLKEATSPKLNERSLKALENLEKIYNIICSCGLEKYISIDLGMLQSIDYYTGVIFKGVTYDVGFNVCGGGRYDSLIENFGKKMSAVGIAISVNRVLSALIRQKKNIETVKTDAIIMIDSYYPESFKTAEKLRSCSLILENYYGKNEDGAIALAKEKGIDTVVNARTGVIKIIKADGSVYNLEKDEIAEGMKL